MPLDKRVRADKSAAIKRGISCQRTEAITSMMTCFISG